MGFCCTQKLLVFILLICLLPYTYCDENITVTLTLGNVVGKRLPFLWVDDFISFDTTVDTFWGIPYAEPPVGNLRFRKPVPKVPWDIAWDATYKRSICWQTRFPTGGVLPEQNEDCLFLNVFSPDVKKQELPVMVWLHGGAYEVGSGSGFNYDPTALVAMNDVIVVTLNYRLNSFGFLYAGDASPGNYGLWDQNMALMFVKEHIREFGGDPSQITLFGQSAGAGSTGFHIISPHSLDLFQRAILMSGSMLNPWAIELDESKARSDARSVGRLAGCDVEDDQQLVDCLRSVDVGTLVSATSRTILSELTIVIPLIPVVDGDFIPDNPFTLMDQGRFKQCEIMLGSTKDDGTLMGLRAYPNKAISQNPRSDYEEYHQKLFDFTYIYSTEQTVQAIEQQYVDWVNFEGAFTNFFYTYQEMSTDMSFRCPADLVARYFIKNGNKVYLWKFNYLPPNSFYTFLPYFVTDDPLFWPWKGVAHAEDIPFVFGTHFLPERRFWSPNRTQEELDISLDLMRYYTNFAKSGNPNLDDDNDGVAGGEVTWEPFSLPELNLLELKPEPEMIRADRAAFCHLWNIHLPKMVTFSADNAELQKQWKTEFDRWRTSDMVKWSEEYEIYKDTTDVCV